MPYTEVMHKWKQGTLKSGGSGKPVKDQRQAVAIMLSEERAAKAGNSEYKPAADSSAPTTDHGHDHAHRMPMLTPTAAHERAMRLHARHAALVKRHASHAK